jgi:O-antigen ligase
VIVAGAVLLIVGAAFVIVYAPFVLARAGVGAEVTELRSINDRRIYAEVAVEFISAYPVTGVGMGNYVYRLLLWLRESPYTELGAQHVHNLPLLIGAELGITGLLLWLFLLTTGVVYAWRKCRDPLAVAVGAGTVALLVVGMFDHYPWTIMHFQMLLWACLAVATGMGRNPRPPPPSPASG